MHPQNSIERSFAIAIYHCSIKIFSRGKGASAVAKAAYRAAENIHNEYNGITSDYTHKTGVVHKEILLPNHAPAEYKNRAVLWNAVEKCERYKTAQLAREIEISLPKELSHEQNISLAREYVQKNFVDKGMCADLCVHDKGDGNPHFHLMLTMRPIEKDGTWGQKSRSENGKKIPTVDWNEQTKAEEWRSAWADSVNATFEKLSIAERIDHRSYERQGVDKIPTIHMGVAASQMEKKGIYTDKGNRNREINDLNKEIRQTKARIRKLKDWLYTQPIEKLPSMLDIAGGVANAKNTESRWQKIRNLQTQAQVLIFLQENDIDSVEGFTKVVVQIHEQLKTVSDDIKSTERRLDTLATHLAHNDNRKTHKSVYQKYKDLTPKKDTAALNSLNPFTKKKAHADYDTAVKKQEAHREKHADAIEQYESARDYFAAVMNGRTTLPVGDWQKEQNQLLKKRYGLCEKFYTLKDEIKSAEIIRRSMEQIMRDEPQRAEPQRAQGMDR